MINTVNEDNELSELGSAVAVGERLRREVIATAGSGRTAELVEAQERELNGHTFYDLEYAVHLEDRDRHELATVGVDRGRLYTLATSVNEDRWGKVGDLRPGGALTDPADLIRTGSENADRWGHLNRRQCLSAPATPYPDS